ncbi:hypothetical protein SAMN06297129_2404 [Pseudooceanicola antarcticus]|uniref:DUF3137 domain-containing protein n=1 Tax=Pseudooceanicola antarcticus TaxID=1247613 RepID=A0A285IXS8_9RHOB|nr:hypothetical protein [Pseudooceanicola antarcticus]PJE25804.1 hypothetical protein CVM39_19060 [Pseudooceanicola antarcticus]SNY52784.1 hypothetical protein SAMN06297129_2404 [Pseudooceanicola antarcticus]
MTGHPFEERAPHEAGFSARFRSEILPIFRQSREEARRKASNARIAVRIMLVLGFGGALWLFLFYPFTNIVPRIVAPAFVMIFTGVIAALTFQWTRKAFNNRIKQAITPSFLRHLEIDHYQSRPEQDFRHLRKLRLLPAYDHSRAEDGFSGHWRDVPYELVEAELDERRSRGDDETEYVTVFKGLVIRIGCPTPMPLTRFEPNEEGLLGRLQSGWLKAQGLRRVDYGPGQGALPFAVFSTDPEEARAQLPPPFLRMLETLAQGEGLAPRRLEAAFDGPNFYLCLPRTESFLEIDAFELSEEDFALSCREALADMALPRQIIDLLIDGPQPA